MISDRGVRPHPRPSPVAGRRGTTAWLARVTAVVGVALLAVLATASPIGEALGLSDVLSARAPSGHVVSVTAAQLEAAEAGLAALEVKGRAPSTGYSREAFGQAWADVDRNGCDTRNDILARDLTELTLKPGTFDCVVLTGTLLDPYSGAALNFQRGERSAEVQIDHVVALSDAWQKGAQQLSAERRVEFANDPANLLAVDGPLNQQKGAADAATWLPPNKGFRCAYAVLQIAVKSEYELWVTAAERDALGRQLNRCVVVG